MQVITFMQNNTIFLQVNTFICYDYKHEPPNSEGESKMPKTVTDAQIYKAALQTVIEKGYTGATTKQIALAADINEVTLFRKYGTKAELVKQAINNMVEQMDFQFTARYTGDVAADLQRIVEMYQGSAQTSGRFFYTVLLEIPRNQELAEIINTPFGLIQNIGELLARYQAEGVLKQEHPLHAVAGLLGPLIAMNIIHNATDKKLLPSPDLERHVAFFLNGRWQTPQNNQA